jgi:MOSC domain-containing protein YiiM
MAEIYSIVFKPRDMDDLEERYLRVPVEEAVLVTGYGIEGDVKGGHPKRNLNVMDYETMQELGVDGFKVNPGELGEQIIIRGLKLSELEPGARLRLGDAAMIEVVEPRTGCERFEGIQTLSRTIATNRLGMMARVVADGTINVGDPVNQVAQTGD